MWHSSGVSTIHGKYKNGNEICLSQLFTYLGPVCLQNREISKSMNKKISKKLFWHKINVRSWFLVVLFPKYVNNLLRQISLPFLYFPWIVETPELCHKKWPDFYLKSSPSISVNEIKEISNTDAMDYPVKVNNDLI